MHFETILTLTGRPTADFAHEIAGSLKFFVDYMRKKPGTHGPRIPVTDSAGKQTKMDFGQAFGISPRPGSYAANRQRMSDVYNRGGASAGQGSSRV